MLFSTADKTKIGLLMLFCPLISSLAWFYTQDAFLSLAIHFTVNLILIPFILNKLLNKNIYDILGFKNMIPETKNNTKAQVTVGLLLITIVLNIVGVYLGKLPHLNFIVNLGPLTKYRFFIYLYYLLVGGLMVLVINVEMKFYYGVLSIMIPDNFIGYLGMGLFMALHWLGFGFAFFNNTYDYPFYVFMLLMIIFYVGLYHVKETTSYKDARWVYLVVFAANYILLFIYGVLYSYRKISGVTIATSNAKNVWNKII